MTHENLKRSFSAAYNLCKPYIEAAKTKEDFKDATQQALKLDGLSRDLAVATLRKLESDVFGYDVVLQDSIAWKEYARNLDRNFYSKAKARR